jgi:antitoxin CptB
MITEQQWDAIKWKSRRGMRELDLMLEPFVNDYLPKLSEEVFFEYDKFLDLSDLELVRYLLRREKPQEPLYLKMIEIILNAHQEELAKETNLNGI